VLCGVVAQSVFFYGMVSQKFLLEKYACLYVQGLPFHCCRVYLPAMKSRNLWVFFRVCLTEGFPSPDFSWAGRGQKCKTTVLASILLQATLILPVWLPVGKRDEQFPGHKAQMGAALKQKSYARYAKKPPRLKQKSHPLGSSFAMASHWPPKLLLTETAIAPAVGADSSGCFRQIA